VNESPGFAYDRGVLEEYPTIQAGVLQASGVVNGSSSSRLLAQYRAEQQAVRERLSTTTIADIPSIAAWRRAFARFGAKPTQYRSAAEALLRRLDKHGDIPSISTLVDLGNLVSIRYALPVAVLDRDKVAGSITVRFATGAEQFADLGSSETVTPDAGEVIFVDADDVVSARRWCWRQSAITATGPSTSEALFVVEGHHVSAANDVAAAVADLSTLLAAHQPAARIQTFTL
jgi:DNA/RNA-binding domain of Phe-tRNA-synthetase-like protein